MATMLPWYERYAVDLVFGTAARIAAACAICVVARTAAEAAAHFNTLDLAVALARGSLCASVEPRDAPPPRCQGVAHKAKCYKGPWAFNPVRGRDAQEMRSRQGSA